MFGFSFEKLILIAVIAVIVVGPQRLPGYAAQLAKLVRAARDLADNAKDRVRQEMGSDFDDVDWKKLDPRQYDPRRIIREALFDDETEIPTVTPVRPSPGISNDSLENAQIRSDAQSVPDASSEFAQTTEGVAPVVVPKVTRSAEGHSALG